MTIGVKLPIGIRAVTGGRNLKLVASSDVSLKQAIERLESAIAAVEEALEAERPK